MNWATDQLVSIVIPICDFEYTLCYYISKILKKNSENCTEADILIIPFISAIFPLFLRIIQCFNENKRKNCSFLALKPDFFNFIKYFASFITVCFSLGYNIAGNCEILFILWVFSAIFSSFYAFYWDIKMDWGFLEKNGEKTRFLREKLVFQRVSYYYVAIFVNLLLRFAWIASLSYGIIQQKLHVRKEVIMLVLGMMEIIRRAIWNFIRFLF